MLEDEVEAILRRKALELSRKLLVSRESGEECPRGVVQADRSIFNELLGKCRVVLADFWAEWCIPCKMVDTLIRDVARRYSPRVAVVKVNIDENSDLAFEHEVLSIPTIIVFHKGREYRRFTGIYPGLRRELEATIRKLVAS